MDVFIICLTVVGGIIMLIKTTKVYTYLSIKLGVHHNLFAVYFLLLCCSFMIWLPAIYNGDNYQLRKLAKAINKLTVYFYLILISVTLLTLLTYDDL